MYISFNISMEFELHGVKFKYEDGEVYRWFEIKCKNWRNLHSKWKHIKMGKYKTGYMRLQFEVNKKVYMIKIHRLVYWLHNPDWDIFDSSRDNSIDHIDGDTTNNDIENLRVVTNMKNQWNRTTAKGYSWNKKNKKWISKIVVNGKNIHLGYFELEEDARQAYLDAKEIYHII